MRIGVLVPFTNTTLEADLMQMCPAGASIHFTRMGGYDLREIPDSSQMNSMGASDISEPLRLIAAVAPDVVLYGCTSATLSHGLEFEKKLRQTIAAATGGTTITAAGALIEALNVLNVKKIGFASPYVPDLNDQAIQFLGEAGFNVVARAEFDKELSSVEQGELSPDEVYALAVKADSPETEAIVLSCTDLKAVDIVRRLEAKTGKPVVTSNQAMMFALSRIKTNLNFTNCPGRLFKMG